MHTELSIRDSTHSALLASTSRTRSGVLLTDAAEGVRKKIFDHLGLADEPIDDLSPTLQKAVIEAAAQIIHADPAVTESEARPAPDVRNVDPSRAGQLAFWTPEEVWSISGVAPRHQRGALRQRGAFATPPELARDVARSVADHLRLDPNDMVDFGDPAVGNGVLYAALRESVGHEQINSARVVEIDPLTAQSTDRRWARSGISVLTGDFLNAPAEHEAWSVVLANPPYRRSQDIAQDLSHLRAAFDGRLGVSVSARADLYVYFMLQADAWMRKGGIAAWIVPSEFQVTAYGAALRTYLTQNVSLVQMHTYDASDPLFDNALASTCVVVFRKEPPSNEQDVHVTSGGTMARPRDRKVVPRSTLRASRRWSFAALAAPSRPNESASVRLGDLFTFRRGIATGANSYFVLDDDELVKHEVRPEWVRPLVPAARTLDDGRIRADHHQNPIPSSGRWLIDTDVPLEQIRRHSPVFASYLDDVEASVGDRYLVARRPSSFKQEPREPAPFLFLYMAKRDTSTRRFLWNESRAIHLNNFIGMYPRPALWERFTDADAVFQRLSSIESSRLEEAGRTYASGLLKLEPRELAQLALPE
ncbi:Eco57I restriction-modification methylase domain-containing protein [Agromyces sp. NPDC058104]|uniref:Eco57I restriction-modification methylase domain-containing protein n=1 Tax=Agromyces sp. NPDC058104 TaxID=3346342 RepID=UPI0036D8CB0B